LVESVAHAALLGFDPDTILRQGYEDYPVVMAVVKKAQQIEVEKVTAQYELLGEIIGLKLAEALTKIF
jgi:hypothetical protein